MQADSQMFCLLYLNFLNLPENHLLFRELTFTVSYTCYFYLHGNSLFILKPLYFWMEAKIKEV